MSNQTRREFLKQMSAASGALALSSLPSFADESESALTSETDLDLCIARWGEETLAEEQIQTAAVKLTEQAMAGLGGMGRFVSKGDVVWVKPNIGWNKRPEIAANTNPDVVATLVRLCLEAGAKEVKVGDHACNNPKQAYKNSGIAAAAEVAGAKVVQIDEQRFKKVDLKGERLILWDLYPEIIESDLVINVPILKHHGLSKATMCMKNYMGVIGGQRSAWHQDLAACLIDITRFMQPRLCVLDSVRALTAHGPRGGNPEDVALLGTVAAGTDIVALDAFGAELLGHKPEDLDTVKAAHEAGLGRMDFREQLACKEVSVS